MSRSFRLPLLPALGALALVTMLPSCNPQPTADPDTLDKLEKAEKAKVRVETELRTFREDCERRFSDIMKQLEEVQKSNDTLKDEAEKAKDDAAKARQELQEYMAKYKLSQRTKFKGLQVPSIETKDSQIYSSVVIKEITPVEVSIIHSNGMTRVPMAKLPGDLQKQFLYDPNEEKDYAEAQAEVARLEEERKTGGEGATAAKKVPEHTPNPIAVRNLRNRIQTRLAGVAEANADAEKVGRSAYANTSLAKERQKNLARRRARLEEDIKILRKMLERELTGKKD